MRSLTISASDRLVPPVKITRQPAPLKKKGARKRSRRKPLPAWTRPVAIVAAVILVLSGLAGTSWWVIDTGYGDRAVRAFDAATTSATRALGLTVQEVTVSGRERTPVVELLDAIRLNRGDSLMTFDPEQARQRIQALSWVETASVRRTFPDRVRIDLVEREPFARWQIGGKTYIIDRHGNVVADNATGEFTKLPKVVGKGAAAGARQILDIINSDAVLAGRVRSATLVRQRRWTIRMDNGVDIRLPELDAVVAWRQLAALEKNYGILARNLVLVDMRVADRLIVRLTPDAARLRREPGRDT